MKVSMVSVSRTASSPQTGHLVFPRGMQFQRAFAGGFPFHIVG
jgi:hypothetical protein